LKTPRYTPRMPEEVMTSVTDSDRRPPVSRPSKAAKRDISLSRDMRGTKNLTGRQVSP